MTPPKQARRGFSLLEMLFAVSILSAVLASILRLWVSGSQSAAVMMQTHQVQEELFLASEAIIDDIRESNVILEPSDRADSREPPFLSTNGSPLEEAVEAALAQGHLTTDSPRNRLTLLKCVPQPPSQAGPTANGLFKRYRISYLLEADPEKPTRLALIRRQEELDAAGAPIGPSARVKTLIDDIDSGSERFVFFRVIPVQGAPTARDLFFTAQLKRRKESAGSAGPAGGNRTAARILHSAHIRGTVPDVELK